jgi:hypothetical protein
MNVILHPHQLTLMEGGRVMKIEGSELFSHWSEERK